MTWGKLGRNCPTMPKEFRPRLPHDPVLIRLAGLNQRTPTLEVLHAIERHKAASAKLLRNGPKLKTK